MGGSRRLATATDVDVAFKTEDPAKAQVVQEKAGSNATASAMLEKIKTLNPSVEGIVVAEPPKVEVSVPTVVESTETITASTSDLAEVAKQSGGTGQVSDVQVEEKEDEEEQVPDAAHKVGSAAFLT